MLVRFRAVGHELSSESTYGRELPRATHIDDMAQKGFAATLTAKSGQILR